MARAVEAVSGARAVVVVEGVSDEQALIALARRCGRDLAAEGVCILAMGGASAASRYLPQLTSLHPTIRLAGLCDIAQAGDLQRGLAQAGLGPDLSLRGMESRGFFVCDADLEDELIRALGVEGVERVLDARGELGAFRTFQRQPAQRGRSPVPQLRRFLGAGSRRKTTYARLLVEAVDLERAPRPLHAVLTAVATPHPRDGRWA